MKNEETNASTKSWTRKINVWSIAGLIIFLIIIVVLLASFVNAEPEKLLGYAVFIVVLAALGILSNRFPIVGRILEKGFASYLLFLGVMIITLGPLVLFNWLSQFILSRFTLGFQLVVFVVWGLLLALAVVFIATERNRERLFNRLQKIGHFAPVAYSINLLMIAVMFFSSVTYVLVARGVLKLNAASGSDVTQGAIADFYFWHFLKAVPLLEVTETLNWKVPLTYESGWTGLVLLLFKLAVIVPVIAAFAWYWKQVGGAAEKK